MKSLKRKPSLAGRIKSKTPVKGTPAKSQMKGMVKGMPGKSLKGRRPMFGGKKGTR